MASEPSPTATLREVRRKRRRRRRWLWLLLPLVLVSGHCGLGAVQTRHEEPAIRARMMAFRDTVIRGEADRALAFIRRPQHGFDASRASDIRTSYWLVQSDHWREADISVSFTGRHATIYIGGGLLSSGEKFWLHKEADGIWYFTGESVVYVD